MAMDTYDIITVGGGVAGSVLAKVMAERGFRVLIIEREAQFRDRVRGEFIFPWGVAEAKELGVYDALIQAGAHQPTYWMDYAGPDPLKARDFAVDTPQKLRGVSIYHPLMQEALLAAAASAGAEVERGALVRQVEPGREPRVLLEGRNGQRTVTARIVAGADGRASRVRTWGGFASHAAPPGNMFAGVLIENVPASAERSICMVNPFASRMVLYLPQTANAGRAYLASRPENSVRLSGPAHFDTFLEECSRSGLPEGLLDGARQVGPLATFDGADSWVEHPYGNGVVLVGDAAATSDPTWGQGLSLGLRDVRVLRDALLANDEWDAAGHAYATAHDDCYAKVHTATSWYTEVLLKPGTESDALRARVLPLMESDPFVLPDTLISGPDLAPPTEAHRARIFGLTSDEISST